VRLLRSDAVGCQGARSHWFSAAKSGNRRRGVNSHARRLPTWVSTGPLLPPGGRRAGERLDQVVLGARQEPAVEASLLAREDQRDKRLWVVVEHPPRHATKEGAGAVMGVEDHLSCVSRG
jgi:hypothetical protein